MRKRNKKILLFIVIALLIGLGICALLWYNGYISVARRYYYKNMGVIIPVKYTVLGIDVSRYQKEINWEQIATNNANKISFAIIKCTEGLNYKDPLFEHNWHQADKHKIKKGAYFYFHPNANPIDQANHFIKNCKLKKGDILPIIDAETMDNCDVKTFNKNLKLCAIRIENAFKQKPIIYTYADFYDKFVDTGLNEFPFWVAHYTISKEPKTNRKWDLWQLSDRARINGIGTEVDLNVFNGKWEEFSKLEIR